MSDNLYSKILATINQRPSPFAEYMEMCLYDPEYGYYNSRDFNIGSQGDFFTSASVADDFAELIAEQFKQWIELFNQPFTIVEMGAGNGNLAQNILNYLQAKYPTIYSLINYIIIEKSNVLIKRQQENITHGGVRWLTWEDVEDNSIIGCFFSNELFDALPVHKVVKKDGQLKEIFVTYQDNQIKEEIEHISTVEIKEYFAENKINLTDESYPEGYETEVNLSALHLVTKISQKLKKGYVLTIDYGYHAPKYYHPQRSQGTLKCYYQHRHHNNPYVNIGKQDITAHVNFTALEITGTKKGLENLGFTSQALFLMALGLGERLRALSENPDLSIADIWHRRNQLHELINPEGLGGFGVLLQSKNLTPQEMSYSSFSH
ncbi:MAG: class I SAM-dependent methyltransferase [Cyanobacterium sp. T60_A2020_053]|nr:class I SAM-dependent methyltransferase [Cyanobacterium sp. T60_A2020_053]